VLMGEVDFGNSTFSAWNNAISGVDATVAVHANGCRHPHSNIFLLQIITSRGKRLDCVNTTSRRTIASIASPENLVSLRFPYCL